MKKYIFLTPGISNMGGSEMFTYNKYRFLSSHGWDVKVFFCNAAKTFLLHDLEQFKENHIPDLKYGISYLSSREQDKVVDRITKGITTEDDIVVESHLFNMGIWGELITARTGAKNILNFMEEKINQVDSEEAKYLEYKMKRREILNASVKSFHRYFGSMYRDDYEAYTHNYMRAYCSNVVTHTVLSDIYFVKADYSILNIGRIDKPYVLPTLSEVKKFVQLHSEKVFNLIVIGGAPKKEAENNIKELFKDVTNVHLYMLGYMYPIPANLIDINDVAIATANSILVSSDEGVPTIAIDIHHNLPFGIYGRTTLNKFLRDNEPSCTVVGLLEDVLIKGKFAKFEPVIADEEIEMEQVFGKQVEFLALSPGRGVAYDVRNMYSRKKKIVNQTKRVLHKLGF